MNRNHIPNCNENEISFSYLHGCFNFTIWKITLVRCLAKTITKLFPFFYVYICRHYSGILPLGKGQGFGQPHQLVRGRKGSPRPSSPLPQSRKACHLFMLEWTEMINLFARTSCLLTQHQGMTASTPANRSNPLGNRSLPPSNSSPFL